MKEAVIVSAARTPIGKAFRGAFNNLESPSMSSYAVTAAVQRAGIDPAEIDDCIWGGRDAAGHADHEPWPSGSTGLWVAFDCLGHDY